MITALYARVSTGKQNTELQKQVLLKYCKDNNIKNHQLFEDRISGVSQERPKLSLLKTFVKEKKIDTVICTSLDRLGRNLKDLLYLVDFIEENGVKLISLKEQINLGTPTTPTRKLLLSLLGAISEFERELIKERMVLGIEKAKLEGKCCHRPLKKIEWDKVKRYIAKGLTLTEIARLQKISYPTLLSRMKKEGIVIKKVI
jgi:DNA invertase Pin-like site-specific DNA recombinase